MKSELIIRRNKYCFISAVLLMLPFIGLLIFAFYIGPYFFLAIISALGLLVIVIRCIKMYFENIVISTDTITFYDIHNMRHIVYKTDITNVRRDFMQVVILTSERNYRLSLSFLNQEDRHTLEKVLNI